jgi:hypothetical protein
VATLRAAAAGAGGGFTAARTVAVSATTVCDTAGATGGTCGVASADDVATDGEAVIVDGAATGSSMETGSSGAAVSSPFAVAEGPAPVGPVPVARPIDGTSGRGCSTSVAAKPPSRAYGGPAGDSVTDMRAGTETSSTAAATSTAAEPAQTQAAVAILLHQANSHRAGNP